MNLIRRLDENTTLAETNIVFHNANIIFIERLCEKASKRYWLVMNLNTVTPVISENYAIPQTEKNREKLSKKKTENHKSGKMLTCFVETYYCLFKAEIMRRKLNLSELMIGSYYHLRVRLSSMPPKRVTL